MRSSSSSRSRSSGATSGSSSQSRSAAAIPPAAATSTGATPATPSSAHAGSNLPTTPLTSGVPSLGNLTNLQQILSGIQVPESALGLSGAAAHGQPEKPSGMVILNLNLYKHTLIDDHFLFESSRLIRRSKYRCPSPYSQ